MPQYQSSHTHNEKRSNYKPTKIILKKLMIEALKN
jgi:hypothetical protein